MLEISVQLRIRSDFWSYLAFKPTDKRILNHKFPIVFKIILGFFIFLICDGKIDGRVCAFFFGLFGVVSSINGITNLFILGVLMNCEFIFSYVVFCRVFIFKFMFCTDINLILTSSPFVTIVCVSIFDLEQLTEALIEGIQKVLCIGAVELLV